MNGNIRNDSCFDCDSSKLAIRLRARFCSEKTVSKETLKRRAVGRLSFPKCNNL